MVRTSPAHSHRPVRQASAFAALALSILALGLPSSATSAELESATEYLLESGGAYGAFGRLPLRDTGVVLQALREQGIDGDPSGLHAAWLEGAQPLSLDLRLRTALALAQLEEPSLEGITLLTDDQNEDGGYPFFPLGPSNVLETALALQLMQAQGYSDLGAISSALDWLTAHAQPEGGYGYEDNEATIALTGEVLLALQAWRTVFSLEAPIEAAVAWLASQQQTSGQLGTGPHPLLDTALGLAVSSGENGMDASAWTLGATWLEAGQEPSGSGTCAGSWDCDPYTTAWAVRALTALKPDLEVASLEVSPAGQVVESSSVTLTATVRNRGLAASPSGVVTAIAIQGAVDGTAQVLGSGVLPGIQPGGSASISLVWNSTGFNGAHYLSAEADSTDRVAEKDESNNALSVPLTITPRVDLAIQDEDLSYSPENPGLAEVITFEARVSNGGGFAATGLVRFVLDPATLATVLSEQTVSLAAGASTRLSTSTLLTEGTHTVQVLLDPEQSLEEGLEDNNTAQLELVMKERKDLLILSEQLYVSPSTVVEPDSAQVAVTVQNQREDDADEVVLQAYMYDSDTMSAFIDAVPVGAPVVLPAVPGNGVVSATLRVPTGGYPGNNYIVVKVDPDNTVEETLEDNNTGYVRLVVTPQGNLNVTTTDITFSPSSATESAVVRVNVNVRNNGGGTLEDGTVRFTASGPGGASLVLGMQPLPTLPASTYATASIDWNTTGLTAGSWTVTGTVDPDNVVSEKLETDNTVSKAITLSARADLSIVASDITLTPSTPEEGDSVTLSAVIRNVSPTTISSATVFLVRIWDGDPSAGGVLLSEQTRAGLAGSSSFTVTHTWSTLDLDGTHALFIQVDPTDVVSELVTSNNVAEKALTIARASRPDLSISGSSLSLSPSAGVSPGQSVGVSGVVKNLRDFAASSIPVRLYAGNPSAGGTPIQTVTVDVPALGQTPVAFTWVTPTASYTTVSLTVVADPDQLVVESDETNNSAAIAYRGRAGAETTPQSVQAALSYHTVGVTWQPPSDSSQVVGYRVYRNGSSLNPSVDINTGGTATADSQYSTSYTPAQAIDGSTTTYWQSSSHAAPWWIELALPAPRVLTQVSLLWHGSYRGSAYKLQGWDGSTWQDLVSVTGNTTNSVSHTPSTLMTTQRVRLYITASSSASYVALYDLRLWGHDPLSSRSLTDPDLLSGVYSYAVTAVTRSSFESPDGLAPPVDIALPQPVTGLLTLPDYTQLGLQWDETAEQAPYYYIVSRDGVRVQDEAKVTGGTASADSVNSSTYSADKARDGSSTTYWLSASHSAPWWWELALSGTELISRVDLSWQSSYRGSAYELQGWDGRRWRTLVAVTGNTSNTVQHVLTQPFPTSRLRIQVTASSSASYAGLYEVEVWSAPKLTTPGLLDTYLLAGPYQYDVQVLNYLGELGQATSGEDDVPPPIPPATLSVTPSENVAQLTWSAVSNPSVTSYLAYRDGGLILPVSEQRTGGTAAADSSSSASYTPDKALDGSTSTYWLSASHGAPWSWELSWSTARIVTKASLQWQASYRGIDYDLQGWDGRSWRTLAAVRNNAANTVTHALLPMVTQKLRVSISRSSHASYAALTEVNLEGLAPYTGLSYQDSSVPGGAHTYEVSVINTLGEESSKRSSLQTVPIPPPSGLVALVSGDDVSLSWTASTASRLVGYHLYRGGVLLNAPGSTNVALGGTPSASSTYASYSVASLNDNNTSTSWLGQADQPLWTAEIAWSAARTLSGVGIAWTSGVQGIDFEVQTRSSGLWKTQATITGNATLNTTVSFPGVSADAFRVVIHRSSGTYPGINELRAFSPAPVTGLSSVDRNVPAGTWQYEVRAVDSLGGESAPATAQANLGTLLPPQNLSGQAAGNGVSLTWEASQSPGSLGTLLYRDDVLVNPVTEVTTPATGTGSSVYSTSTSYQASNAYDGNSSSYWYSATGSAWTYTLDWTQPRRPTQLNILWHSSYRGVNYDIQSWNGSLWVTELEVRNNAETTVRHILPSFPSSTRLRLNILSSSSTYAGIYELDVLEATPFTGASAADTVTDNGSYRYSARAISSTLVSAPSNDVWVEVSDTGAPAIPGGFRVTSNTSSSVSLAWNASTDADLFRYKLYYPDDVTALTLVNGLSYSHSSVLVANKTTYTWHLTVLDRNGNESASTSVTFAPPPPAPPSNLAAVVQGPDVMLTWTLPTDALRKYIHVYRDGLLLIEHLAATATTTVDGLAENGRHSYQVASEDIFGRVGALSAAVSVVVNDTDLSLSSSDLFFLPQVPSELDDVMLSAVVNNDGQDPTEAIEVLFYDGDPSTGGTMLGSAVAPALAPGELGLAQLSWNLTDQAGEHVIFAVVDPHDLVIEFYEDNNSASKALHVDDVPRLDVTITQVNAEQFPTVVTSFQVKDSNGQAVPDLTSRNLTLLEDGAAQVIQSLALTSSTSSTQPKVDLVSIIDTSGSMDGELVDLPKIMTDLQTQLVLRGVDARQVNYSMSTALGGVYTQLTQGIFHDAEITIQQEDWAPATAWVAKNYPWRTDAVRIIVPVSDENCYNGDGQDANDVYSLQEAIRYANTYKATVYGLWGEPTSASVKQEHVDLSHGTGGEAFSYLDANNIVDSIVLAVMNKVAVYKLTYSTSNAALDGTVRALELTASYRNAEGTGTGEYQAPSSGRADLAAIQLEVVPGNPGSGVDATVKATVANLGSAAAEALVHVTDGTGATPVLKPIAVSLSPGQEEVLTYRWLAVPGSHTLTLTLDPADDIAESREDNNQAEARVVVPGSPVAELALYADELTVTPAAPLSGDTLTLSGVVRNLGITTRDVLVQVYRGEPEDGKQVGSDLRFAELAPLSAVPFQVEWNSSGVDGEVAFTFLVDPLNAVAELREDNNRATLQLPVEARALSLRLQTDQSAYPAQSDVAISGQVVSLQAMPFTGSVSLAVKDEGGTTVAQLDPIDLERLSGAIYPDRRYFVAVTLPAAALLRGQQAASAAINFTDALTTLGGTGSLSLDSIRVAEVDATGERVALWPARAVPTLGYNALTSARVTVLWNPRNPALTTGNRLFRIYFDTQEAGTYEPEAFSWVGSDQLALTTEAGVPWVSRRQTSGTQIGAYSSLVSLPSFGVKVRVAFGDLDGDGLQDLLAYDANRDLYWQPGLVDGSFGARALLHATDSTAVPSDLFAADFNQDGLLDMLVTEQTTVPRLYLQGAGRTWTVSSLQAASYSIYAADLADINADGLVDVVLAQANGLISVYLAQGSGGTPNGTFAAPTTLCDTPGSYPYGLSVADFDGDGTLDLLSNQGSAGNVYLCRGNASGPTFGASSEVASFKTTTYAAFDDLDFNGDGKRDILMATYTSKSGQVSLNQGNATSAGTVNLGALSGDTLNAAVSGGQEQAAVVGLPGLNVIPTATFTATWNTGLNLAGPFTLEGLVLENGDERTRATTPFSITASEQLGVQLRTDRQEYGLNELVEVRSSSINQTLNASLSDLEATLVIRDPAGLEVFRQSFTRDLLLVGEEASWSTWFAVGSSPPGTYTAELTASAGGASAQAETTFEVRSTAPDGVGLTGSLGLEPAQGLPGTLISSTWDVFNQGNAPLTGVPLQLVLAPQAQEEALQTLALGQTSLLPGMSASGTFVLNTTGISLGEYQVVLQAQVEGVWRSLALSALRLVTLSGELSVTPGILEGGQDDAALTWQVSNGGPTALENLEITVRILDAQEASVAEMPQDPFTLAGESSVGGQERWPSAALLVGDYTVVLESTFSGVTVVLATQPLSVIDSIAPLSRLEWQGRVEEQDGMRYMPSSTLWVLSATDSFSGVQGILWEADGRAPAEYLEPLSLEEGAHSFAWQAVDVAGNVEPLQQVRAVVDDSSPVIRVSGVSEGDCVKEEVSPTVAITDLSPVTSSMAVDGASWTGTPITSAGVHVLSVTATDVLGQSSTETVQFKVETGSCACAAPNALADADQDGERACDGDCNDQDPGVSSQTPESTDGKDNDCDGLVDEGLCPKDADGDGFATSGGDCDDLEPSRNPAAPELEDGIDNNCDGQTDNGSPQGPDADQDGLSLEQGDCDDTQASTGPGALEIPDDGQDNNCNGQVDETRLDCDGDGDGFTELEGDCNDLAAEVYPGAEDVCDALDQDCDGLAEEDCATPTASPELGTPTLTPTPEAPTPTPWTPGADTPTPWTPRPPTPTPAGETPGNESGTPGSVSETPGVETPGGDTGTPGAVTPTAPPDAGEVSGTPTETPDDDSGSCRCTSVAGQERDVLPVGTLAVMGLVLGLLARRRRERTLHQ